MGVFTSLYFVIVFASGMIGFAGPAFMFIGWVVAVLLNGVVIALFLQRTPKFGALGLLGLLVGLLFAVTGHPWFTPLLTLAIGLLADVVHRKGREPWRIPLAYGVLCLSYLVPLLPILYGSEAYFAEIERQVGAEYAEGMRAIFQPWVLGVWGLCLLALGLLAGFLGRRVCRRSFGRAGLT